MDDKKIETQSLQAGDASNSNATAQTDPEEDEELNKILDDALLDFKKPVVTPAGSKGPQGESGNNVKEGGIQSSQCEKPEQAEGVPGIPDGQSLLEAGAAASAAPPLVGGAEFGTDTDALFSEVFTEEFADQAQRQFEAAMKWMSEDQDVQQQFQKLAEVVAAGDETEEGQKAFSETLQQTMTSLASNAKELGDDTSEQDLIDAISQMSMGANQPDFFPMMQGMMKSLLSRDVLYPSLKEISDKYPAWFSENEGKIGAQDMKQYRKQYDLMQQVLGHFDSEQATDTDAVKQERFQSIIDLMQQMQECGQPPKELVGDMPPDMQFDPSNFSQMMSGPDQQCSVM